MTSIGGLVAIDFLTQSLSRPTGISQGKTYLERFLGWSGLLGEPIPSLCERARRCRRRCRVFNCALAPFEKAGQEVEVTYGNLMSIVNGAMGSVEADAEHVRKARQHDPEAGSYKLKVRGRALSSLIDECGLRRIDFLSLDVEGYEEHVLKGLDFSRHRPTYICVEASHRAAVEQVLLANYTIVEQLTDMDVLYRVRT